MNYIQIVIKESFTSPNNLPADVSKCLCFLVSFSYCI